MSFVRRPPVTPSLGLAVLLFVPLSGDQPPAATGLAPDDGQVTRAAGVRRAEPAAAVVGVAGGAPSGQQPTPEVGVAGEAPSGQQPMPQFGATVARVRVDVVVMDEDGRFIDDLAAADFVLREDGVEQRILSVQLVDLAAGRVRDLPVEARVGPAAVDAAPGSGGGDPASVAGAQAAVTPAAAEPEAGSSADGGPATASDLGAMVFFIDGMSLDMPAKARFVRAMEEVLQRTDGLGVPRALYLVRPTGDLDELQALTTDESALLEAIGRVREASTFGTSLRSRLIELLDDMQNASRGARLKALSLELEDTSTSLQTLELLTRFCNALSARRGRTALVWVSTGVKLAEGGPYAVLTGLDDVLWQMPHRQIAERARQLHEAANSANVSIYAIDPTLITEQRSMGFDIRAGSPGQSDALGDLEVQGAIEAYRDALRNAAEETGGRAFIHWSDLDRALDELSGDTGRYYLLTYATPEPLGDGEYHEIDVEVRRPGLEVRERRGYIDLSEDDRRFRMIEGALALPGTIAGLEVRARAYRRWGPGGRPFVQLAIAVEDLWSADGTGAAEGTLDEPARSPARTGGGPAFELHALAVRDHRVFHGVRQRVQPSSNLPVPVPPTAGAGAEPSAPIVYVYDWDLGPGEYDLHLAIQDVAAGRLGATKIAVEVPEATDAWAASDLVLVAGAGDGPRLPVIDGEARFGQQILAYLEVKGGSRPLLSGEIFNADGSARLLQLPAVPLAADDGGLHRGALRMQGLPPGEYTLQVTALDPEAGKRATYREPLRIAATVDDARFPSADARSPSGEATIGPAAPALAIALERLSRVAELYTATALDFVAAETIREERYFYGGRLRDSDRARGRPRLRDKRTRTLEFDYIYGRREPEPGEPRDPLAGSLVDLRRQRGSDGPDLTPERVVEDERIAGFVSNGFLWVFAFSPEARPRHTYDLVGTDRVLGRPALVVRFDPRPPIRRGVNGWHGTAWVDQETYQLLKIEAHEPADREARDRLERFLDASEGDQDEVPGSIEFTAVTATFAIERNGMRFPDTIVAERNVYRIAGKAGDRSADAYPLWRVRQTYEDYRFFNIHTEAEVRAILQGGTEPPEATNATTGGTTNGTASVERRTGTASGTPKPDDERDEGGVQRVAGLRRRSRGRRLRALRGRRRAGNPLRAARRPRGRLGPPAGRLRARPQRADPATRRPGGGTAPRRSPPDHAGHPGPRAEGGRGLAGPRRRGQRRRLPDRHLDAVGGPEGAVAVSPRLGRARRGDLDRRGAACRLSHRPPGAVPPARPPDPRCRAARRGGRDTRRRAGLSPAAARGDLRRREDRR